MLSLFYEVRQSGDMDRFHPCRPRWGRHPGLR